MLGCRHVTCSHCGDLVNLEDFKALNTPMVSLMRKSRLCFGCAYWMTWIAENRLSAIIVDGGIWEPLEPLFMPTIKQAIGKSIKLLMEYSTRRIYGCNSIALRSKVPDKFVNELPDQYTFITFEQYRRIYNYDAEMCLSKGCFDRYQCFWYNAKIAEPNEPWNKIPKNYKIGSECCPSFVNKNDIYRNN